MNSKQLEQQLHQLEKRFQKEPAVLENGRSNPKWWALRNKIRKEKEHLDQVKKFEFLAQ